MRSQPNTIQLKTSIPGPRSTELMKERYTAVARGPFQSSGIFVKRASGALIEDVDGNRLIDLSAGIGVVNAGHCPSSVVEAIREQANNYLHTSFNVLPYEGYIRVAQRLNERVPISGTKKTFLANSGAEAVENAIKIARAHTQRPAVICFDHAFHGRTYMAMTLTSKAKPYKNGFGPFMGEVYRSAFPYTYRWPGIGDEPTVRDEERVSDECFAQFEDLAVNRVGSSNVAAVIIEPILGEGGFLPAPRAFLKKLREFCTANGIVLIADEIQTGFGRTGTLFACEQLGVEPDLMTLAKGIATGMPLSAVTGRADMMDAPLEGGIGGTYGGNPLACASALATLDLFEKGDLLQRARGIGELLNDRLNRWYTEFPIIGNVRGLGPMRAIELVQDRTTKKPDADSTKAVLKTALENGVIALSSGTYGNVVRFLPPLAIAPPELDEALDVVERALRQRSAAADEI